MQALLKSLQAKLVRGEELISLLQGQQLELRNFYRQLELAAQKPDVQGASWVTKDGYRGHAVATHDPLNDIWYGHYHYYSRYGEGPYQESIEGEYSTAKAAIAAVENEYNMELADPKA